MNTVQIQKNEYLKEADSFFKYALQHAEEGTLQSCAGLILKALDKERRARGVLPQVLHLIKTKYVLSSFYKILTLFLASYQDIHGLSFR